MSDQSEIPEKKSEEKSEPKEMGRPTIYSQEIADEICNRLSHGETLRTIIASSPHLPCRTTIYRWNADNEDFRNQYTKARAEQADYYAELIVDESYSSHDAGIGRLRVDALKWAASKMAPKKYGDKIEVETSQPLTLAFQLPSRAPERVQLESNERTSIEE
jgi:hypothetical protein